MADARLATSKSKIETELQRVIERSGKKVGDRLPKAERWTHFFKGNKSCPLPPKYSQLDYLLLPQSLAASDRRRRSSSGAASPSGPTAIPGCGFQVLARTTPRPPITVRW